MFIFNFPLKVPEKNVLTLFYVFPIGPEAALKCCPPAP